MVRWGIAGLGRMARVMAEEFALTPNARVVAVGSRSGEHASAFADELGIPRAHDSYQKLVDDPDVEAVYVANPHPQHRAIALASIAAGKPVLIEKSMAATYEGVCEIVGAARAAQVYCAEALWSRFVPAMVGIRHELASGIIGDVMAVQGDLQAFRIYDEKDRLFAKELGGGALLDLGVYTMSVVHDFLGAPEATHTVGSLLPNGVDGQVMLTMSYPGGRCAQLSCGFTSYGPARMTIFGTRGYAEIEPRMHHAQSYVIHPAGREPRRVEHPLTGRGHWHMLTSVSDDIRAGKTESETMPLQASVDISRVLHDGLDALGVHYRDQ